MLHIGLRHTEAVQTKTCEQETLQVCKIYLFFPTKRHIAIRICHFLPNVEPQINGFRPY